MSIYKHPGNRSFDRRTLLKGAASVGLMGLAGRAFASETALPAEVPQGVTLSIADRERRVALETSGLLDQVPFRVDWANISGGPYVIEAWRAGAIDIGACGGIPPQTAHTTGLDVKVVAFRYRTIPAYTLAISPNGGVKELGDLRGKRIGFSASQEQGLFVLQALKLAGVSRSEVTLVNLRSAEFQNALSSDQIDAAPISEPQLTTYLNQFGRDGAITLRPDIAATPSTITALASSLEDPDKLAAIHAYVRAWYPAVVWAHENRDTWIDTYYVRDQHVTAEDGERILDALGTPAFPEQNWDQAVAIFKEANEFLADEGVVDRLDIENLFDRRFERIPSEIVGSQYLTA